MHGKGVISQRTFMAHLVRVLLVLSILLPMMLPAPGKVQAQIDLAAEAERLLSQMTVAERVGQLFLVTFEGDAIRPDDPIVELLVDYHVSGVVLRRSNDNITGRGDTPAHLAALNNQLQSLAQIGRSALITETVEDDTLPPTPTPEPDGTLLPLLIAVQQEGDGPPYDQILRGLTEIPSPMAVGATWHPPYAEQLGQIQGRELAALGINMLFGPSLDVLTDPAVDNGLGVRSYGGNPYWVGLMGQAFTTGLHNGSAGRLAVIAKHFPGAGGSDRPLGEDVATVRRSLEELQAVELAPFMAVTAQNSEPAAVVDGLLATHIRYLGFQSNVQSDVAPVSFDSQALQTLLALPVFNGWRQAGGLVVSDALGSRAVQRYYDDTGAEFPHRRVAKDALFAGNDLLYLGDFALQPAGYETQLANVKDTITWFQDRYQTDPSFQIRIDDAVRRILQLKLRLYEGVFSLDNVLVEVEGLVEVLNRDPAVVFEVAQNAVSLVVANAGPTRGRLPSPPVTEDQIVIFTDTREGRQCSGCPPTPYISTTSLEEKILALYGPEGSNQIQFNRIRSFTFSELETFLEQSPLATPTPPAVPTEETEIEGIASPTPTTAESVDQALQNADWIIFAMLDQSVQYPSSDALKAFLAQRPDLVRGAEVVVFGYNAPYFLDSTEISKLSAYYAVYSKIEAFVNASVRALFQELPLSGNPPVDVSSVGYRLADVTRPDGNQIIELFVHQDGVPRDPAGGEPLEALVGQSLRLRTGVIYDYNGNPVPDGTVVQFMQQDRLEGFTSILGERLTTDGVAELDYVLEARTGQFRITATAGDARNSQLIDISISDNRGMVVEVTLTPAPTETPTPTPSPTATVTPSPTPTPTATVAAPSPPPEPGVEITLTDVQMLLSVVMGLVLVSSAGVALGRSNGRTRLNQVLRLVLWGLLGSLLAYNYYALSLPGSGSLDVLGSWAGLLTTIVGGLVALFAAYRLEGAA